jgi:hypothetical protein
MGMCSVLSLSNSATVRGSAPAIVARLAKVAEVVPRKIPDPGAKLLALFGLSGPCPALLPALRRVKHGANIALTCYPSW